MAEFQNRTLICSVLFVDIVEYSRKPVVEQSQLKDRFNALLSEALRGVAINDRIILDTGDGAAISFIGDPEDALFVATDLRDATMAANEGSSEPQLSTRMGINLGPVRLVKDINGQPNIIGDGINVAQRVMTFAKPEQVLVSRSYYEVVSRLSDESSKLFSYEGARTDKHIREHEVYAVGAFPGARKRYEGSSPGEWQTNSEPTRRVSLGRASQSVKGVAAKIARKPRVATVLAVAAILGIALGARAFREADEPVKPPARQAAVPAPQAPAPAAPAEAVVPENLPPIRGLPPEPQPAAAVPPPDATPPVATPPDRKGAPRQDAKMREKAAPRQETIVSEARPAPAVETPAPPPAPASVSFAISPWGEVHVDGRMAGVSPPLQDLELQPGRHRIELRNSAFPPHTVTVTAKSGERLRIQHKFK